jgi:branched-chain amino acid transport system ATP-binding protein
MTALLEVRNVETYYGPINAIKGVSLDVADGAVVTVLGANGAGKSTLLKTVAGVMNPFKGTIVFDGRSIAGLDADEVARSGLSLVPEGRQVFPFLSVRENLMMGAFARRRQADLANEIAAVFDYFPRLRERERVAAGLLSGGEQQMLAIGRALMAKPRLLLLDEPSLGLSPLLVAEIFAIVARINRETRVGVLLVEQNARRALDLADFGYVLELGRIVMADTGERLQQKDDIRDFYLGQRHEGVRDRQRWRRRKTWR